MKPIRIDFTPLLVPKSSRTVWFASCGGVNVVAFFTPSTTPNGVSFGDLYFNCMRSAEDKRARLVSFADNAREMVARHRLKVETGGPGERRLAGLIHDLGLSGIGELRRVMGRSWRRKLARLLDPDEITERDFWRIVAETMACVGGGTTLDEALQESIAAVTSEPTEWQAEF